MADAYTQVSSVDSVQAAYDTLAYFALRRNLHFDQCASVKPTKQSIPSTTVTFTIWDDLPAATTTLTETADVDAVALSDSTASVTLLEKGNAAITTARLRGTSFFNVDEDAANIIGFNAGLSQDELALDALKAGTNVRYAGTATARNQVTPSDTITANLIRRLVADLRTANVPGMAAPSSGSRGVSIGEMYKAFIHPHVSYDLRIQTGAAAFADSAIRDEQSKVWNGYIGTFAGADFIETSTAPLFADAGSSTTLTDVYATLILGFQALAKAWSSTVSGPNPQVVVGPVTDKLRRFHPVGWYWLGGYGRFREASIRRLETASSIGANS